MDNAKGIMQQLPDLYYYKRFERYKIIKVGKFFINQKLLDVLNRTLEIFMG